MKKIILSLSALLISSYLFAQSGVSFHAGTTVPLGDFSRSLKNDTVNLVGGTGAGINAGVLYHYTFSETGFGLQGGVDFNFNTMKKEEKNNFLNSIGTMPGVTVTHPKYYNISLLTGANYTYALSSSLGVFADASAGVNFLKMTDTKVNMNFNFFGMPVNMDLTYISDKSIAFAYKGGAGLIIKNRYTLAAHYCALGSHKPKTNAEARFMGQTVSEKEDLPKFSLSAVTITMGLKF